MVLPIVVASDMVACGGREELQKLAATATASTLGLLLLLEVTMKLLAWNQC